MKFVTLATLVTATVGASAAQAHRHAHAHVHKHAPGHDGNVVTVYELAGQIIPAAQVHQGLKNGTLALAPENSVPDPAPPAIKVPAAPAPAPAPTSHTDVDVAAPSSTPSPVPVPMPKPKPKHKHEHKHKPKKHAPKTPAGSSSSLTTASTSGTGVDAFFPDGQLDCSTFPSQYGAVAVDWMGLGGWSGAQAPQSGSGGFANIMTVVQSMCLSGNCCAEGMYCSYACPPGYQKSQWPTTQGATGQSVGGILCQNGKLHLTNPSLSKSLCMKGTDKVTVQVQNTMSQNAAVCRTDYPGTEGETIPLNAAPGTVTPLTCPDAANYYTWQGSSTSAQYYVNPRGVPVSTACQWGSPANPWGNFAPLNLGVGYSNGAAWLSIFQNLPTTNKPLDFSIELVGDNGGYSNLIGRCKYSNGQYCSGDNYSVCSSDGKGCTVNVPYGTATFVFS